MRENEDGTVSVESALEIYEPERWGILQEAKKQKTPDEAAEYGYKLGYSKGYNDGLIVGYAEAERKFNK